MLSSESIDNWESSGFSFTLSLPPSLSLSPRLLLCPLSLFFVLVSPLKRRGVLFRGSSRRYRPLSRKPRLCPGEHSGHRFHPASSLSLSPPFPFQVLYPMYVYVRYTRTRIPIHVYPRTDTARCLPRHVVTNFNATREKERSPSTRCRAAIPLSIRGESFNGSSV